MAKVLSGGERSRLLFIGLSLGQYELLLLDEPTNHLDMEGKEALAEQIALFQGAIILVSHDQWLIENSCQRFGLIHQQKLMEFSEPEIAYIERMDGNRAVVESVRNFLNKIQLLGFILRSFVLMKIRYTIEIIFTLLKRDSHV